MIRRTARLVAALVLATVVVGTGPADAGTSRAVPLTGTLSGSVTITLSGFVFKGGGTIAPLGAVTNSGLAVVNGVSLTCVGGLANVHTETLTTTDGDTLTLRMNDVGCPNGVGTMRGTGNWTVVGGTGKYAGATGAGSAAGGSNLLAGTFAFSLDGWVSVQR